MALFKIKDLDFLYPDKKKQAIKNINLKIDSGEFICICGKSGSGKSTLLKHLKPSLSPHGLKTGLIEYKGKNIDKLEQDEEVKIGYVFQNPDNQIVTDKVWHELAFTLENQGLDSNSIRLKVAEMASFFGIQNWFHKETKELSGGQKQILNLASVMAMDPDILILDEPTSQLDPIASRDFLDMLKRINEDLGTTILISEHRLEDIIPISERLIVLDAGEIVYDGDVRESGEILRDKSIFSSFPTSMQIYDGLGGSGEIPINVKEARTFIGQYISDGNIGKIEEVKKEENENIINISECFFRYERKGRDIVKNLNLEIEKGKIHSILGGNGTGKSTSLFLLAGIYKPYRGSIKVSAKKIGKLEQDKIIMLPQDPQSVFVEKTVEEEIYNMDIEKDKADEMLEFMELGHLLSYHPYDLSGGEQQKLALSKVLLKSPDILLLDEVTKGLDGEFKEKLGEYFRSLANRGTTIVMVSHDIEFCARYSDKCSLFFDGGVISTDNTRDFFSGNNFYTTKANRIIRDYNKDAITVEDVIEICKK